ncbi:hypothetical protein [Paraburkholderia elongata]|uniref:Uncharacterized protein n=1 Tax=Paraburkholderia elongata TaxID=2675747 RepID=A0A972NKQ3_9BURK|nr:hypothetical protein [Paraburkholderia elongata]NPT54384.1 hypothetical protein [Paraburkholderia elongata]
MDMTVEDRINMVFNWFDGAPPGHRFDIRSTVELETGQENPAFAQFVRNLPHIRSMSENGWITLEGRSVVLTEAGHLEMQRRNGKNL